MMAAPPLYIFDLDGTLALIGHRRHFVESEPKDWQAFFKACSQDVPNIPVMRVMQALLTTGAEVWVWSGRSDEVYQETVEWLHRYWWMLNDLLTLKMRRAGDHQPDDRLKRSWLQQMRAEDRRRLVAVFDDRTRIVNMWRSEGVPCFQVADGDF